MNFSNYTIAGNQSIIDCGTIAADFQDKFSFNFKLSIILGIILICIYMYVNYWLDKQLYLNNIDNEKHKNTKSLLIILFYIYIMMSYFIFYTIFLMNYEW